MFSSYLLLASIFFVVAIKHCLLLLNSSLDHSLPMGAQIGKRFPVGQQLQIVDGRAQQALIAPLGRSQKFGIRRVRNKRFLREKAVIYCDKIHIH